MENNEDNSKYELLDINELKNIYGSHFTYANEADSLMSEKKIIEVLGHSVSTRFYTVEQLQNSFVKNKKAEIKLFLEELDDYYEGNKVRFELSKKLFFMKDTKEKYLEYAESKERCLESLKDLSRQNLDVEYLSGRRVVYKNRLIPNQVVFIANEDLNNLYVKEAVVSEIYTFDKKWVSYDPEKIADVYFRYVIKESQGRDFTIEPENAFKYNGYYDTNNYTRKVFLKEDDAYNHVEQAISRGIKRLNNIKIEFINYRNGFSGSGD